MNRLRLWSALFFTLMLTSDLRAQNEPAAPWVLDRALSVDPQPAPALALRYRLLPPLWELKEGNAIPIYLRLNHEQSDAARKYLAETPKTWNALPVDQVP